jgi:hypothetical protein
MEQLKTKEENVAESTPVEKSELREFSRKYDPGLRNQIARNIWELRKSHKETHAGDEQIAEEIENNEASIEDGEKQKAELLEEISTLESQLAEKKEKIWSRIVDHFTKESLKLKLGIEVSQQKLSEVEKEIGERLDLISKGEAVISDTADLDTIKSTLADFYTGQENEYKNYEHESAVRDVANVAKNKNVLFNHPISRMVRMKTRSSAKTPRIWKTNLI